MANYPSVTNSDNETREVPWHAPFLIALSQSPVVTYACIAAKITRQTAYRHREENEEFAKAWDDALEQGWDKAEQEAYRRAVEGYTEPVYGKSGDVIGERVVYSDRLLEVLLKGNRAKTYRESYNVEMTGKDRGAIQYANNTEIETAKAMYEQLVSSGATPEEAVQVLITNGIDKTHLNGHGKLLEGKSE